MKNFKTKCLKSLKLLQERISTKLEDPQPPQLFEPETVILKQETEEAKVFAEPVIITRPTRATQKKKIIKSKVALKESKLKIDRVKRSMTKFCTLCQIRVPILYKHVMSDHMKVVSDTHCQCTICGNIMLKTTAQHHYQYHNLNFHEPKPCTICGKTFTNGKRFEDHHKKHIKYECDHCGKHINSKLRLRDHLMTQHMGAKRCYFCKEFFYDHVAYKEHLALERKNYTRKSAICEICGYDSASKNALDAHKARHHSDVTHMCTKCGKIFPTKSLLHSHNRQHHEEHKFACAHCGKKYSTKRSLTKHVQNVHIRDNYMKCDVCGKMLLGEQTLKTHMRIVHTDIRKHVCGICGKAFKIAQLLRKHYYSHENKRPLNCHMCTTGYYCVEYLQKHYLRIHGVEYTVQEVRSVCHKVVLDESKLLSDATDRKER